MFVKSNARFNMAVKEWFRKHQPPQLYIVLIMTILFLIVELAVSHITHALTLLMNSYQMLCNILALIGYIVTVKFQSRDLQNCVNPKNNTLSITADLNREKSHADSKLEATEHKLKNTFGWARIDVVSMLICCVFCASLCFSVLVEALQTLIHIDHLHEMHNPISVLCMGVAGFLVNTCCYILIGGYTFHQGCFLYVTEEGEVVLNKAAPTQKVRQGERRLSRTRTISTELINQRQNFREMCRDTLGCVLVITCSVWVHFADEQSAKYIDPGIAVVHAVSLMILSFPYMKESCFILLQTMPGSIDIDSLKVDLVKQFPDIVNVHDFHVWQLTANKVVSTVHIIFQNPEVYTRIIDEIKKHFISNGITQVTIQPEFFTQSSQDKNAITPTNIIKCLMACQASCGSCVCCPESYEKEDNGYSVKVNHARNCITGGIISLVGDSGAILDKDCNLAVTGCVDLKDFSTHKLKYTIKKAPMPPIEGEIDACEAVKNIKDPSMLEMMKTFSVPAKCPIKAEKICSTADNKINISKYKNQMGMAAGTVDIKLEGTHDTGKTCIEINFTLAKEKRSG